MTNYYVDSTTGSDSDNGTTFDLAWATAKGALESGGLSAGDTVLIRPIHSEIPITDILPAYDGVANSPITIRGWSRAAIPNTTITQADFTNGSKIIDNVVGITPSRIDHTNRYITGPDGKQYHITAVIWEAGIDGMAAGAEFAVGEILTNTTQIKKGKVWGFTDDLDTTGTLQYVRDSATAWVDNDNITSSGGGDAEIDSGGETAVGFILSAEYVGSTVTGVNGKFQIDADPDYAEDQAIDDSAWTIKKTDWDSHDLPCIDFNDGAFQLYLYADVYHVIKNIEFKDSTDTLGIVHIYLSCRTKVEGCLFKQTTSNTRLLTLRTGLTKIERIILEGSGAGSTQYGIFVESGSAPLKKVAVFNCGDNALHLIRGGVVDNSRNINFGVEMANGGDEIHITVYYGGFEAIDVELGGTNGYALADVTYASRVPIQIGNFQKILGNQVSYFLGGAMGATGGMANVDIGDSNAPSAASPAGSTTDLACFYPNVSGYEYVEDFSISLVKWKIWAAASAETYTVYIQNNMGVTLNDVAAKDDIWLKLAYIDSADGTKYTHKELFSTEIDILQRTDATDWDSLTIANHTPAVAGWAILELFVSKYSAAGQIYVDPKYV